MYMQVLGFSKNLVEKSWTKNSKLNFLFIFFALAQFGCVENGDPHVEDLIKVKVPWFSGQTSVGGVMTARFTTQTLAYTLKGFCDPASYILEYSINDGSSWTQFADNCNSKKFSIPGLTIDPYLEVLVRAKGKFSYTKHSKAKIVLLLPPTSNNLYLATSSRSDKSDRRGLGTQNIVSNMYSGEVGIGTTINFSTYLPELIYNPEITQ